MKKVQIMMVLLSGVQLCYGSDADRENHQLTCENRVGTSVLFQVQIGFKSLFSYLKPKTVLSPMCFVKHGYNVRFDIPVDADFVQVWVNGAPTGGVVNDSKLQISGDYSLTVHKFDRELDCFICSETEE